MAMCKQTHAMTTDYKLLAQTSLSQAHKKLDTINAKIDKMIPPGQSIEQLTKQVESDVSLKIDLISFSQDVKEIREKKTYINVITARASIYMDMTMSEFYDKQLTLENTHHEEEFVLKVKQIIRPLPPSEKQEAFNQLKYQRICQLIRITKLEEKAQNLSAKIDLAHTKKNNVIALLQAKNKPIPPEIITDEAKVIPSESGSTTKESTENVFSWTSKLSKYSLLIAPAIALPIWYIQAKSEGDKQTDQQEDEPETDEPESDWQDE